MEIAAQSQPRRVARQDPEIFKIAGQVLPVVLKSFVGMRRSYNVFNAIVRRHAAHLQGHVPGLGTVVHLRQNVAMDIDHVDFRGGGV